MLHSESSNYIAMYLFDEEIVFFTSCFIQLLLNLCESDHFIYIVNPPFQLGTAQPQSLASSLQLSFNVSKAFSRELKDSTHAQGLYKYVIYSATCLHQLSLSLHQFFSGSQEFCIVLVFNIQALLVYSFNISTPTQEKKKKKNLNNFVTIWGPSLSGVSTVMDCQ